MFINQAKGDSLAEMMLESMYGMIGEGDFAILSSTPTATNQNAWIDFMKKQMASEPKYSKMKLVQIAYGEESEQVNQQQALALVEAFPNLKGSSSRPESDFRRRRARSNRRARSARSSSPASPLPP